MMTMVVMIVALFSSAVAQSLVPPLVWLAQAKAPFLFGLVVYYALMRPGKIMVTAAFAAGLLHDALSFVPLGYTSLFFCAAGFLIFRFRDVVVADSPWTAALVGSVLAGAITPATYWALASDGGGRDFPLWWVGIKSAGTALLGLAAIPVVFAVFLKVERLLGIVKKRESR